MRFGPRIPRAPRMRIPRSAVRIPNASAIKSGARKGKKIAKGYETVEGASETAGCLGASCLLALFPSAIGFLVYYLL